MGSGRKDQIQGLMKYEVTRLAYTADSLEAGRAIVRLLTAQTYGWMQDLQDYGQLIKVLSPKLVRKPSWASRWIFCSKQK